MTDIAMPVISTWNNSLHGLEAAFVFWNVCLGLAVFFLARVQALLYFINNIDNKDIVVLPETLDTGNSFVPGVLPAVPRTFDAGRRFCREPGNAGGVHAAL